MNTAWYSSTYYFYMCIIIVGYVVGVFFENKKIITKARENKVVNLSAIFVFLALLFIKGFAYCGTDLVGGYRANFMSATSYSHFMDKSLEMGFIIFNIIVRKLTSNYHVIIFLYALLTLLPIFILLQKYQDVIDHSVFLASYIAIFFFQGISLIRIYLAASFSLFVFENIAKEKYLKAVIWILICSQIHVTSIILFIPLIFKCLNFKRKNISIILIVGTIFLIASRGLVASLFSGRYSDYTASTNGSIGMFQFILYIPIICLYHLYRRDFPSECEIDENKVMKIKLLDTSYLFCIFGFALGILSYFIPIFGRLSVYTLPLIFFNGIIFKTYSEKNQRKYLIFVICLALYLFFRYYMYIKEYHASDGIMPYKSLFDLILKNL